MSVNDMVGQYDPRIYSTYQMWSNKLFQRASNLWKYTKINDPRITVKTGNPFVENPDHPCVVSSEEIAHYFLDQNIALLDFGNDSCLYSIDGNVEILERDDAIPAFAESSTRWAVHDTFERSRDTKRDE